MSKLFSRCDVFSGGLAVGMALVVVFLVGSAPAPVWAEDLPGLTNPQSPWIFPPLFRAEVSVSPIWVNLSSGKVSGVGVPDSWDLENVFKFDSRAVFIDFMARLQAGRFSIRGHYEGRDFSGEKHFQDDPDAPLTDARFSYPGVRIGGDVDLVQRQLSRFGVNVDYDLLSPTFTEASETPGGFKITGSGSVTLGIHGVYNPTTSFCGISPLLQFYARWPVSGTELTDVMLGAGLRAPETVLGSVAVTSGWRHTRIEMGGGGRTFDMTLDGWFSELVYYY